MTEYFLKSNPEKSIEIPNQIASTAEYITRCAMIFFDGIYTLEGGDLCNAPGYTYLKRPGVIGTAKALSENPEDTRLQDLMYLKICTCEHEKTKEKIPEDKFYDINMQLTRILNKLS
jgi:hypothetical protein